MINAIDNDNMSGLIEGLGQKNPLTGGGAAGNNPGEVIQQFGNMLQNQMNKISELNQTADQQVQAYASGDDIPVHQVMIAMEKAGGAMDLAVQVRNKLITAYQEMTRMAV